MSKDKQPLKIAFPHMGNVSIAWASALRKLGVEPFIPPKQAKRLWNLLQSIVLSQFVCHIKQY